MRTMQDLVDFSFDVKAPGQILQDEGYCIANWLTSHAMFMTSRDRRMRVHRYPLEKERYTEVAYQDLGQS